VIILLCSILGIVESLRLHLVKEFQAGVSPPKGVLRLTSRCDEVVAGSFHQFSFGLWLQLLETQAKQNREFPAHE
jgi:hypothetical protein